MDTPHFHEDWYGDSQLEVLACIAKQAPPDGMIVEVGCWEGKSTIAIAKAVNPRAVFAIDHWRGNTTEGDDHESVKAAKDRDVRAQFDANLRAAGVRPLVWEFCGDWREAIDPDGDHRIAFAHLDAGHDYRSTYDLIEAVKVHLVPGGILCGDDYTTASKTRDDLDGGVERAVCELLPGHVTSGNLWAWCNGGAVAL